MSGLDSNPPRMVSHRKALHETLASRCLWAKASRTIQGEEFSVLSNADSHSEPSVILADRLASQMPQAQAPEIKGSSIGSEMESCILEYLAATLGELAHLAPWSLTVGRGKVISTFAQYAHLEQVQGAIKKDPELELTFGGDYLVRPDLVVTRQAIATDQLNEREQLVSESTPRYWTPARRTIGSPALELLHASVSCKWTLRSDRAQNARTESLNLIRNRKGRLPHIVLVTMEPLPSRLASIAVGTGDLDCVYHCALPELMEAADWCAESWGGKWSDYRGQLDVLVRGDRLRDIADLTVDLLA